MIVILCSSFVFVCQTFMKLTNIILIDSNLILVEKENVFVLFEIEIQHDIRVVFSVVDQGELWAGRVLAFLLTESLGMTTRWIYCSVCRYQSCLARKTEMLSAVRDFGMVFSKYFGTCFDMVVILLDATLIGVSRPFSQE